jgi:hypothetical protein
MVEDVLDIAVGQEDLREALGESGEAIEGVLAHDVLLIVDQLVQMREAVTEAMQSIVPISEVHQTTEEQGTGLPLSGVGTLHHSGDSVSHLIEQCPSSTADEGGQGLDGTLSQLWEIEILLGEDEDGCHDVREQAFMQILYIIPHLSLHVVQLVSGFLLPAEVLCPNCIPKLQGEDGGIVALVDMGDGGNSDTAYIASQHGVAVPAKFEEDLIDFTTVACGHIGKDDLEELHAKLFVHEYVPQEGDTIPEGVEGDFNNIAILPDADEQATQDLLADLSVDDGLHVLEFFADEAEGGDGGAADVNLLVHRVVR